MIERPDYDDPPSPDYYEILQVSPNADREVIEAAYHRLVLKYRPARDRDPEAARWVRLLDEAFAVLRDPSRRAWYDRERKKWPAPRLVVRSSRIVMRATPEEPVVGGGFLLENGGRGTLRGTVVAEPEWLEVTPGRFGSTPASILFRVDTRQLPSGRWHSGQIRVQSNGGEASVPVTVLAPPVFANAFVGRPVRLDLGRSSRLWRGLSYCGLALALAAVFTTGWVIVLSLIEQGAPSDIITMGNLALAMLLGPVVLAIFLAVRQARRSRRLLRAGGLWARATSVASRRSRRHADD